MLVLTPHQQKYDPEDYEAYFKVLYPVTSLCILVGLSGVFGPGPKLLGGLLLFAGILAPLGTAVAFTIAQLSPSFRSQSGWLTMCTWLYAVGLVVLVKGLSGTTMPAATVDLFFAVLGASYAILPWLVRTANSAHAPASPDHNRTLALETKLKSVKRINSQCLS